MINNEEKQLFIKINTLKYYFFNSLTFISNFVFSFDCTQCHYWCPCWPILITIATFDYLVVSFRA